MKSVLKSIVAGILFILFSVCNTQAQVNLAEAKNQDSTRVDFLVSSAEKIVNSNPKEAMLKLQEAEALANELSYKKGKATCYFQMAKIYHGQKAYDKASQYASEGSYLANSLQLNTYKKPFFMLLSEIEYDKNIGVPDTSILKSARDIASAIKYKYYLKDSLDKTEEKAVTLQNDVKAKENELIVFRLQGFLWALGFVVIAVVLSVAVAWFSIRKMKMEYKQLLTEQKLKRSQMNPHFIFNSIQNVRSLIHGKKEEAAVEYLNKFSKLTRQILESSNENYISLAEEIDMLHNYLSIQKLLHANSFEFIIKVADNIDPDNFFLPPMLAQPFVENAIKHGLLGKERGGQITVEFYLRSRVLYFEVRDNGVGFSSSKQTESHKSMAMSITKERLIHYSKKSNLNFQAIDIKDEHGKIVGAKVLFEIPYIYEN